MVVHRLGVALMYIRAWMYLGTVCDIMILKSLLIVLEAPKGLMLEME